MLLLNSRSATITHLFSKVPLFIFYSNRQIHRRFRDAVIYWCTWWGVLGSSYFLFFSGILAYI